MCRFTTKLFNSPSLPGLDEFAAQIKNVTGLDYSPEQLDRVGLNIMGIERLINTRLGVRREHDTLPERWFEEPVKVGAYKGEKIDRKEFDATLTRFYQISRLTPDGAPVEAFRRELMEVVGATAGAST
jgi:aldehyde:ferredoxin oxidoreductase